MSWTKTDQKGVRRILYDIAADTSQTELSHSLGAHSRATVNNWIRRGRVPLNYIGGVIARARALGMDVRPGQLHPYGHTLENLSDKGGDVA